MAGSLVSIVMAVRNGAAFLEQSIESIRAQTYPNWELILVDDGSDDNSPSIAERLRDPRIKVLKLPFSMGQSYALSRGIEIAGGAWIARQDADDLSVPRRLAQQLFWAQVLGPNRVIASSAKLFGEKTGTVSRRVTWSQLRCQSIFHSPVIHSSVFAHHSVFERVPYDASLLRAQDYDWFDRLSREDIRVLSLPSALVHYRVHPAMVSRNNRSLRFESMARVHRRVFDDLGVVTDRRKMEIHFALSLLDPFELPKNAELNELEEWVSTLIRANSRTKAFPVGEFSRTVRSRFKKFEAQFIAAVQD